MQPNSTAIVVTEGALDGIAERINDAVFNAQSAACKAVQYAMKAGELLNQAKQSVDHGAWENWLVDNVTLSPRTCRAYMRLAKVYPALPDAERQRVADLPVREAVKAITTSPAGPTTTKAPSSQRVHVADRNEREAIERNMRAAADALRKFSKAGINASRRRDVDHVRQVLTQALESLTVMEVADAEA